MLRRRGLRNTEIENKNDILKCISETSGYRLKLCIRRISGMRAGILQKEISRYFSIILYREGKKDIWYENPGFNRDEVQRIDL